MVNFAAVSLERRLGSVWVIEGLSNLKGMAVFPSVFLPSTARSLLLFFSFSFFFIQGWALNDFAWSQLLEES